METPVAETFIRTADLKKNFLMGRETVYALAHRIAQAKSLLSELDDALTRIDRDQPEPLFQTALRHIRSLPEMADRGEAAPARESFKD